MAANRDDGSHASARTKITEFGTTVLVTSTPAVDVSHRVDQGLKEYTKDPVCFVIWKTFSGQFCLCSNTFRNLFLLATFTYCCHPDGQNSVASFSKLAEALEIT